MSIYNFHWRLNSPDVNFVKKCEKANKYELYISR